MTTLFISGSGTEIGKTFVCCRLITELKAAGRPVRVLKPIASGFDPDDPAASDTGRLLQAQGLTLSDENLAAATPWRFRAPLSVDIAAALEQRAIDFAELVEFCRPSPAAALTLIEGVGGVMAPIGDDKTVLDWVAALACPALLVVGSYLGTLSHSLTAAGMLAARGVELAGVVVNESPEPAVAAATTAAVLRRFLPSAPIMTMPRQTDVTTPLPALLPRLEQRLG